MMSNERMRNQDARDGDVLVNDSIASGRPDLPIHEAPARDTSVAIDADQLGPQREPLESQRPKELEPHHPSGEDHEQPRQSER
jgi:hypothetical protein